MMDTRDKSYFEKEYDSKVTRIKKDWPELIPESLPLSVGPGWLDLIHNLCREVMELPPDKRSVFTQIKDKFGGIRLYVLSYSEDMDKLLRKYESMSFSTCAVCGNEIDRTKLKEDTGFRLHSLRSALCTVCEVHRE